MNDHDKKMYLKGYQDALKKAITIMEPASSKLTNEVSKIEENFFGLFSDAVCNCSRHQTVSVLEAMMDKEEKLKNE